MNREQRAFNNHEVFLIASRTDDSDGIITLTVCSTKCRAENWITERAGCWSTGYNPFELVYGFVGKIETNINANGEWVVWYILALDFDDTGNIVDIYNRLLEESNTPSPTLTSHE
jgi:hypothetical protein